MALTQISTAGVKDDAVTSGKIPANAIGSSEIAANAVGSSELADNAVDTNAIANDAVTTAKIAADAIDNSKIANNAVNDESLATNAVTTAKIANNAINSDKIATNAVNTTEIADTAVTLAKLEHGTSSNDGKFLRANNGADPSFESIPAGITINNQADNRIITATGTTDTLNSESNVLIDSSGRLLIGTTTEGHINGDEVTIAKDTGNMGITLRSGDSSNSHIYFSDATGGTGEYAGYIAYQHSDNSMHIGTNSAERIHIKSDGKVGIGMSNPDDTLDVNGTFQVSSNAYVSGTLYALGNDIRIGGTGTGNSLDDYEEGTWTPNVAANNSGSYTARIGNYTKIGNIVHVDFYVDVSSVGYGVSYFRLGGLPFTSNSNSYSVGSFMAKYHGMNNNRWYSLYLSANNTIITAYGSENTANWELMSADSTFEMIGQITYRV